jgi:hypothetical protein
MMMSDEYQKEQRQKSKQFKFKFIFVSQQWYCYIASVAMLRSTVGMLLNI